MGDVEDVKTDYAAQGQSILMELPPFYQRLLGEAGVGGAQPF